VHRILIRSHASLIGLTASSRFPRSMLPMRISPPVKYFEPHSADLEWNITVKVIKNLQ